MPGLPWNSRFVRMRKTMKNTLFVLILLGTVALMAAFNLPGEFESQEVLLPEENETEPEEGAIPDGPEELRYALELEELMEIRPPDGKDRLLALSQRDDAVGYKACLFLARTYGHDEELNPEDLYRRALSLHDTRDIQKELALYLVSAGLVEEAGDVYNLLLPDHEAIEALLTLGASPESVAESLSEKGHWQALAAFVQEMPENQVSAGLEQHHLMALVRTGRHEEALSPLKKTLDEEPYDEELAWHYARALELSGRAGDALPYYEAAGERGHHRRGIILDNQEKLPEAADAFSAAPEPESRWRGARMWESLGKLEKALAVYMDLAENPSAVQDDAAYRAFVLLNRSEDERAGDYLEIIDRSPAWMERLNKETRWELEPKQPRETPGFIHRIEAYREAGRNGLADLELAIQSRQAAPWERVALGQWYLEADNYFMAVRQGIRALREYPCLEAYRTAYLKPFMEEVHRAAGDYQLDPYLLLAVMREESHYRSEVISSADARGLMQIMPATGKDIASRKNMDFELDMLFDPETNIRFGAWYLRAMLNMFDGDLDKALAAYNAGPGHARRWSESPLGREPLGFPTAITFIETREYITKVKNSYYTYLWLYENGP